MCILKMLVAILKLTKWDPPILNQLVNIYRVASHKAVAPALKNLTIWGDKINTGNKSSIVCGTD